MFFVEALIILSVGFCLLRILGKKTVSEMTGLELITMLSMASVTGHAVSEDGLGRTIITLCLFVALLITVQYLAIKFNFIEKLLAQYGLVQPAKAKPKNDLFQEVFQYHESDKKEADSIHLE